MERYVATQFYKADSPESRILRESGIAPSEFVLAADAQATIAALQARVTELEAIKIPDDAFTYCAYCGEKSPVDEHNEDLSAHIKVCPKHPMRDVESQLTQRTAELEAAKAELEQERVRLASCLIAAEGGTKDIVKQGDYGWSPAYQATLNLQAELERVRGERDEARDRSYDEMTMAYCQLAHEIALPGTPLPTNTNDSISFGKLREVVESVVAHLTRVRDQYADLRKMVLALPKVEGEITANRVCTIMMHGLYCEEFTKLLQHRQGMEG